MSDNLENHETEYDVEAFDTEHVEEGSEESVAEGTLAADSLATHPVGKADAMAHLLGHMNAMSKGEAIDFFQKVMAQFGPGKEYGVGDNSAHNSQSIDTKLGAGPKTADAMPRLNVKEDLETVFAGQELSEEFVETATTLFEAAISARVIAETARLEEEYEVKLQEELTTFGEEITSQIDMYMTYAVENWMKDNAVAIESTLRNEIMEDFMEGLKNLFAEHYIDVPEDKVDVLEAMAEKVDALESKLDEAISENAELRGFVVEGYLKDIFEEISSDLALTQQEKFAALAEGIEFDGDMEVYANKLLIIKENYFKNESSSTSTNINEEVFEGEDATVRSVDPVVNRYVQALARTVKK